MSNQSLQLQLFVMGDNRCGQAGTGGDELLTKPTKISGIDEHDVFRIISNGNQSFAILFNATVFSAGENDNSELCRPGKRSVFQRIDMLETFKIVDVAMGEGFFHLLAQNGQLLSYGKNDMGQLGTGNRDSKDKPRINANIKEPLLQIASGLHHTVALTKSGQVSTWGGNRKGQLGDGQLTSSINPIPLIQLRHRPVISITCGEYHTAVLTSGGNVFTWGANDHGQLGHGDTTARLRPELVRSLRSNKVINIACGRSHSLFLAANYLLFATGSNTHGQCGQELGFRQVVSPTVVEYFREKRTIDIACGALHSFVIATSLSNTLKRKLYVMGSNACGQLGLESLTNTDYPTISSINANLIEAIFAYPLSLTSFLLTFENLCSVDDENIDQNVVINPKIRMRPFPSVSYEEISSLLNRLPADPSTVAANRQAFVDQHIREVREAISAAFSSISVLNASFLSDHSTSSGYNQFVCVDLYSVRRAYESIMRVESTYPSIVVTLGRTLVHICDELKQCPFDDSENLSVFFILLENPLLLRTAKYHIVLEKLVSSILSLPKALRLELFKRMKSYPSEYFGRIVTVMMQFLHLILTDKTLGLDSTPVILVLETLHASSVEMENILPNRAFYHETLPKEINLLQEWQRFQDSRAQQLSSVVNYWQYPFLIDEQHKFQVLQYEYQRRRVMTVHSLLARYDVTNVIRHLQLQHQEQLQQSQSATHTESLDDSSDGDSELGRSNGDPAEIQRVSLSGEQLSVQLQSYLPVGMKVHLSERLTAASFTSSHALPVFTVTAAFHVQVRRSTLLADIRHLLSSVLQSDPNVLFLPIKVQFEEELGEDLGGLTKELFTLLVRQLMQDSGAFALSSSGQTYWFSHHNSAIPKQVENNNNLISWEYMLGLIQSLAMYHGIQIDIPLPRSIFKTLTGKEVMCY
jgi:alpha-tubulin suppressor-like RCC1 family protein